MKSENRRVTRFIKWIRKYHGWWYLICTPNDANMNPEMMRMLIRQLAKESFFEIILVLLMVHRDAAFMEEFYQTMFLERLIDDWDKEKDKMIEEMRTILE